ncbi:YqzM family protein [Thalassobacillus sp. CUG 92003]|nr:YqzM family protein [Thalassobacillus sp. CUG 92003]
MNEFKKEIQSKNNDVVDSGMGFIFSFVFFFVIFFIGVIFNALS